MEFGLKLQSILGLVIFLSIALLLSEKRSKFNIKTVVILLLTQTVFASAILKTPIAEFFFGSVNKAIITLQEATEFGTSFVFGYLGGAPLPFELIDESDAYIFAFRGLPLIIFFSALTALLFYVGVLPFIISKIGKLIRNISNISEASALGSAANIFIGMVESPMLIKPYLVKMSRGDLFIIMTTGMCTVAGTVFAIYVVVLNNYVENVSGHILISSVLSAFAGVLVATIMVPPENPQNLSSHNEINALEEDVHNYEGFMDALTSGTNQGLIIFLNVLASIVVMLALVYLLNGFLSFLPDIRGEEITLQYILGLIMAPLMWVTGMNWQDALTAGQIMGIKTVFNELLAFIEMGKLEDGDLSPRSRIVTFYAVNGFANLSSLGIMLSGLFILAPERKRDILQLGFRSIISGTLATLITASVISICL